MNHIFNISRIPDDKTLIDNLEEFKIMLEAQRFYCYQCQCDLANLSANYNKKKEKYKKLKIDIVQLNEKNHQQNNEICNLKLQIEFLNKMAISPVNYVSQNNYLQMNTNNQIQIPIPPPPPAPINLVENNKKISKTVMSDVIKELKSKIKPYDA
jgi:hypothetical protein